MCMAIVWSHDLYDIIKLNQLYEVSGLYSTTTPMVVTPVRAVRRVEAVFVSRKVNGHNAP